MKVWKLLSPKVIAEEERPDSIASPTQAKVKIAKVLIAYPEIRAYTGAAGIRYPRVPGMYAIGVVVEAGEGCVKVEKNTRVFLDGVAPCGECAECKKGNKDGCLSPQIAGINKDGFLRDFIVAEEADLSPLPPSVSDDCALYTGLISLCEDIAGTLDAAKGTHVAVIGAGETGNILAQLLIYHQAVPILIDSDEERLAAAAACGVYYTLKADENLLAGVSEITGGRMAEGCVYTSFNGLSPDLPFDLAAPCGKVIYAGMEFAGNERAPEKGVGQKTYRDGRYGRLPAERRRHQPSCEQGCGSCAFPRRGNGRFRYTRSVRCKGGAARKRKPYPPFYTEYDLNKRPPGHAVLFGFGDKCANYSSFYRANFL